MPAPRKGDHQFSAKRRRRGEVGRIREVYGTSIAAPFANLGTMSAMDSY
jgi:hypothetical protein